MATPNDGPPPGDRQLARRPEECPFCGRPIVDEFHWFTDTQLNIDLGCSNHDCDWNAYVEATIDEPGDS